MKSSIRAFFQYFADIFRVTKRKHTKYKIHDALEKRVNTQYTQFKIQDPSIDSIKIRKDFEKVIKNDKI